MEAKELMIGDWVNMDFNYPPTCKSPRRLCLDDMIRIWQGQECEPIPLTAEILEKNGLDKVPELSMVLNRDTMPMYHSPMLHYVHELQHALRLCGLNDLANNIEI